MAEELKNTAPDLKNSVDVAPHHIDQALQTLDQHIDQHLVAHENAIVMTEHYHESKDTQLEHAQELAALHQEIGSQLPPSPERLTETKMEQTDDTHVTGTRDHTVYNAQSTIDMPTPSTEQIAANRTAAAANTHEFITTIKQKPRNIVQKWLGSLLSTA